MSVREDALPESSPIDVTLSDITKLYPGVTALGGVSLDLRAGEVHAIVGENGAGKSTLIKVLAGAVEPSAGSIVVDGESHDRLTPALAQDLGIAVIYQEFTLVPTLNAAENVFLGHYLLRGPVLDRKRMYAKAEQLFARLGVTIDPRELVGDLTTGYQQIVEIAKALSRNARLLIMDEPSAPLTAAEVEAMYKVVDALRAEGMTIVYISHRMEEIFRLSDRVSVLRDGRHIATKQTSETTRRELIGLMVGRELTEGYPTRDFEPGEVTLRVDGVSGNGVRGIRFEARAGEILGFAGLIGAGRTELMELLFGAKRIEAGEVTLHGRSVVSRSPIQAIGNRIALVPEDRKRHGLVLPFSIAENITLPLLKKRLSRGTVVSPKAERDLTAAYMADLRIKAPSGAEIVGNLSGGNQQKVVLAKWLATDPEVLIFDEPTRGIDVGARAEIYLIMNRLAAAGKTILMISSDMEELIGMSDRVVVLREGNQEGILRKTEITQETVMALAAQGEPE
ncbi:sugar ABC transporter ATP-binding protein [Microbacterium marinilacus]|uniref:Ribose ABC transporter ATP-binding protein RbsA n=1 Tax=Microbacterium marinilacus TaxID=415209 RepID=A0ABP7B9G9_9MICO|nr:sugar ABC transporter ATP-binding protein [Microbacterium marinilacus]MBY0687299.1 sugar ABC transporter ATP-binding protein [Microbacterium marinilacus]